MFDQYQLIEKIINNLASVTIPASPHNTATMTEVYQQLVALSKGLREEEKRKEAVVHESNNDGPGENVHG